MIARAERIMDFVRGPDVLDLGCAGPRVDPGSPYWLHGRLRGKVGRVVGVDLSHERLRQVRAAGHDHLIAANAEALPLNARFNTIVAGELIEHVANPGRLFRQAQRLLGPGGRLVLTTPYSFALFNVLYALIKSPRTCSNPEHSMWFDPGTLAEHEGRADMRVVRWELIPDHELGNPSFLYRACVHLISWYGPLLPRRLSQNAMLFVLKPSQ